VKSKVVELPCSQLANVERGSNFLPQDSGFVVPSKHQISRKNFSALKESTLRVFVVQFQLACTFWIFASIAYCRDTLKSTEYWPPKRYNEIGRIEQKPLVRNLPMYKILNVDVGINQCIVQVSITPNNYAPCRLSLQSDWAMSLNTKQFHHLFFNIVRIHIYEIGRRALKFKRFFDPNVEHYVLLLFLCSIIFLCLYCGVFEVAVRDIYFMATLIDVLRNLR
jgi:hypothetical protein